VSLKQGNLRRPALAPGDFVQVGGLESESGQALNGQRGHVVKYIEATGGFQVNLEAERLFNLKADNVARPPLGKGDSVEIQGLESESGKLLNGQRGVLLGDLEEGRFKVGLLDPEKVVSVRPENLTRPPLGPGVIVEVSGLESENGRLLNGQRGTIKRDLDETSRFEVRFKLVCLSPANLTRAETPLTPGDCVVVSGLAPESGGKMLNGQKGTVTKYLKETGQFQVRFGPTKLMSLATKHLQRVGPGAGDNVEVSGLESESGKLLNGQRGTVVTYVEGAGRFQVRFGDGKLVNMKAENLGAWKPV